MILMLFITFEPSSVIGTDPRLKWLYSEILLSGIVLLLKLDK